MTGNSSKKIGIHHQNQSRGRRSLGRRGMCFFLVFILLCAPGMGSAASGDIIVFPEQIRKIEQAAFENDQNVQEAVLPDGILEIGSKAFRNSGLKTINLPGSLTSIAADAFPAPGRIQFVLDPGDSYARRWAKENGYIQESTFRLSAEAQFDSIRLTWEKAENAECYEIYQATSESGPFSLIRTVEDPSVISWSHCPGKPETAYYYRVRAVISQGESVNSNTASVAAAAPEVAISQSSLQIRVGEQAQLYSQIGTHYGVYLHELWSSSDNDVASVDPNTGMVKGVSEGTATISLQYGPCIRQAEVTVIPAEVLSTPTINDVIYIGMNTLRVDWNRDARAMGYYIYRSATQNGTYEKIARITFSPGSESDEEQTTVCFEDHGITAGKHYYKVQAFDEKGTVSDLSNPADNYAIDTDISTPVITSVSTGRNGLVVTWKKNLDYDNSIVFDVMRSETGVGAWEFLGTDEDREYRFIDTSSKASKAYYYAVQPSRMYGSSVIGYGALSRPVRGEYDDTVVFADSISLSGIDLLSDYEEMVPGDTLRLKAKFTPENTTEQDVTWRSTNPDIIYVDQNGNVTALAEGTARVICTYNGDNSIKARRDFYVGEAEEGDYLVVEQDAARQMLSIRASGVCIAEADEWISLSKTTWDGNRDITYTLEECEEDRTGTITIRCGTASQSIRVLQRKGNGPVTVTLAPIDVSLYPPEEESGETDLAYDITITHPHLGTIVENGTQKITSFGVYNGVGVMNWTVSGASVWYLEAEESDWAVVEKTDDANLKIQIRNAVSSGQNRQMQFSIRVGLQRYLFTMNQKAPVVRISHEYEGTRFLNENGKGDQVFYMLTAQDGAASNLTVESSDSWSAEIVSMIDGKWTVSNSEWLSISKTGSRLTLTNRAGSDQSVEQSAMIQITIAPYASFVFEVRRPAAEGMTIQPASYAEARALLFGADQTSTVRNVQKGKVRYISQYPSEACFVNDYWVSERYNLSPSAKTMCTRAVYSMALSYLGVDCKPVRMSELTGTYSIDMPYDAVSDALGEVERVNGTVESLWNNYTQLGYSPVYIHFKYTSSVHALLLIARDREDPTLYYAVNPGGWTDTSAYSGGRAHDHIIPITIQNGKIGGVIGSPAVSKYDQGVIDQIYQWKRVPKRFKGSYTVKHRFVVDGKMYQEAELLESYNGVTPPPGDSFVFFMDMNGTIVTDPIALRKLFTMQLVIDTVVDNGTHRYQADSSRLIANRNSAIEFLTNDQAFETVGKILGATGMAFLALMSPNPVTIGELLTKMDPVDIASDMAQIAIISIQIKLAEYITTIAIRMINTVTALERNLQSHTIFYYEDVEELLEAYLICGTMIDYANGMTRPIVEGNLAKYHNSFDLSVRYMRQFVGGWIDGITSFDFKDEDLKDLKFVKTIIVDYAVELIENRGDGGTWFDLMANALGKEFEIEEPVKTINTMRNIMTDFASIAPDKMPMRYSSTSGYYINDIFSSDFYRNHLKLAE